MTYADGGGDQSREEFGSTEFRIYYCIVRRIKNKMTGSINTLV